MDNLSLHRITGCSVFTLMSRISQARRDARLSQERVGRLLGVSRQTISNWERHRVIPSTLPLLALCAIFGINPLEEVDFEIDATASWDGFRGPITVHAVELTRQIANRTFIIE